MDLVRFIAGLFGACSPRSPATRKPKGSGSEKGRAGEDAAARFLQEKGLRVLERNFRCPIGEIDIVCRDGDIVVFVEVKGRAGKVFGTPQEAVTRTKQRRLTRLALWYLKERRLERQSARFDVVAVNWREGGPPRIHWIANAFEAADAYSIR